MGSGGSSARNLRRSVYRSSKLYRDRSWQTGIVHHPQFTIHDCTYQIWHVQYMFITVANIELQCSHMLSAASQPVAGTLTRMIAAVQWSHDESVLPGEVKAALENRQAGDQRQASLPDATANQQQVQANLVSFVMQHVPAVQAKADWVHLSCYAEHSAA